MKINKYIPLLLLGFISLNLYSQEETKEDLENRIDEIKINIEKNKELLKYEQIISPTYFELGGGLNFYTPITMTSNFKSIDSINLPNCCSDYFDEYSGYGFGLNLFSNFYRVNKFSFGFGIGFNMYKYDLISTESLIISDEKGEPFDLRVKHYLNTDFQLINFYPTIDYNFNENFAVFTQIGVNYMLGSNAEQYTDINNSEYLFDGISEVPTKIWNKQDAKITNLKSININTDFGFKYNYFVSEKSSINLKVFYQLYPLSFSNDFDFNFSNLAIGLSFTKNFEKIPEEINKEEIKDEIKQMENDLVLIDEKIKIIELQKNLNEASKYKIKYDSTDIFDITEGKNTKIDGIQVEQFKRNLVLPVLNQIFFEFKKYELPLRYKQELISYKERNNFKITKLAETLDLEKINHNLINIVGDRMLKNPTAKLTIIGNSDGSEQEKLDSTGFKRALLVKSVLMNTFGLQDSNLIVVYREMPLKPTTSKDDRGDEENRRVEFESDTPEILMPITLSNQIKQNLNNEEILVKLNYDIPAGVKAINSKLINYDAVQSEYYPKFDEKTNKFASVKFKLNELYKNEELLDDLIFENEIIPITGSPIYEEISIPVSIKTIIDKEKSKEEDIVYQEYTILLPFANEGIGEFNRIMYSKIDEEISNSDIQKIVIDGYTDDIGDKSYNQTLSKKRAETISEVINKNNSDINIKLNNRGVSNTYNNKTPEGRFLNRSVYITVEKRVK